jgi:protein-disulfide isomerase
MARLEADMASEAVTEGLAETYEVAQTLGITGTPTYVVGEELIVGAVGVEDLTARLDQP